MKMVQKKSFEAKLDINGEYFKIAETELSKTYNIRGTPHKRSKLDICSLYFLTVCFRQSFG